MVKEHAWSGPAHHGADSLAHLGAVAMDGTLLAGGLTLAEFTAVEPRPGVLQQLATVGAKLRIPLPLPAIQPYHLLHYPLLLLNLCHDNNCICILLIINLGNTPEQIWKGGFQPPAVSDHLRPIRSE